MSANAPSLSFSQQQQQQQLLHSQTSLLPVCFVFFFPKEEQDPSLFIYNNILLRFTSISGYLLFSPQ
jgi:hypothetical protein